MPCTRRTVSAVRRRHEVLRDLENQALVDALESFASAMQRVRRRLRLATKLRYQYERHSWLLHAARDYIDAVTTLHLHVDRADLRSRGFLAVRANLADYTASQRFTALAADTRDVMDQLATVTYCMHISGLWVTVSRYDGQADYSAQVAATFERFKQGAVDEHLADLSESGLNHVEAGILDRMARLFPTVFAALDGYAERHAGFLDETVTMFDREVQFYLAYLDFITPLRRAGLAFCYPRVSDESKRIVARETFDLALADTLPSQRARRSRSSSRTRSALTTSLRPLTGSPGSAVGRQRTSGSTWARSSSRTPLADWAAAAGTATVFIDPGSSWQNERS